MPLMRFVLILILLALIIGIIGTRAARWITPTRRAEGFTTACLRLNGVPVLTLTNERYCLLSQWTTTPELMK
jgi:hypothetical protein